MSASVSSNNSNDPVCVFPDSWPLVDITSPHNDRRKLRPRRAKVLLPPLHCILLSDVLQLQEKDILHIRHFPQTTLWSITGLYNVYYSKYYKFSPWAYLILGWSPSLVKLQAIRTPSMFHPILSWASLPWGDGCFLLHFDKSSGCCSAERVT